MSLQMRILVNDSETDFRAYVVVDRLIDGRAMGGTRMTADVDIDEVADLAEAMTLKLALAGLPIGGAKAGITSDLPAGPARDAHLVAFGRAVAPLLHNGIYLGSDQGISYRDRDIFFSAAKFDPRGQVSAGLPCDWAELWRHCHEITGYGVCEAAVAALADLELREGCRTASIQGFGTVGRAVATGLARRGLRVVAVADRFGTVADQAGLPVDELLAATDDTGTIDRTRIPARLRRDPSPEAWLDEPADVLVLAAGGDMVNAGNVDRVTAKIVVEGGNLACSPAAAEVLAERGVPVLPGIVANCGGAAVTGLVLLGTAPAGSVQELTAWLFEEVGRRIRANVSLLLARARTERRPLGLIAADLARERLSTGGTGEPARPRRRPVAVAAR
jgi:glutamate dehydrogenase (NAD(P)+)